MIALSEKNLAEAGDGTLHGAAEAADSQDTGNFPHMAGGQIILGGFPGFSGQEISVQAAENLGMGIGQQDPALCFLPGTEGPERTDKQAGLAGADGVVSVLPVSGQLLIHKHDMAEGSRREGDKPVVHKKFFCFAVIRDQPAQGSVHDQRAAGDIVLDEQAGQGDGSRIPTLVTEKAVSDGGAVVIGQGTVGMHQDRRIRAVLPDCFRHGLL